MPLEVLLQCGFLLTAVVAAFVISSAIGMLAAGLWGRRAGSALRLVAPDRCGGGPVPEMIRPNTSSPCLRGPRGGSWRRCGSLAEWSPHQVELRSPNRARSSAATAR